MHVNRTRAREFSLCAQLTALNADPAVSKVVSGITSGREQDLEAELEDARAQINDLILEIEAVAATEEKSRDQCIRTIREIADLRKLQQDVILENSSLKNTIKVQQEKLRDAENKYVSRSKTMLYPLLFLLTICFYFRSALLQGTLIQQEAILKNYKLLEQQLNAEVLRNKQLISDLNLKLTSQDILVSETELKYISETQKLEQLKKRASVLSNRLVAITGDIEKERKLRYYAFMFFTFSINIFFFH